MQMRRIAKLLARLPVEERRKLAGVGPRRAEIIVAGAAVYAELLERCRLGGFRYSPLDCAMDFWRRWRRSTIATRVGETDRVGTVGFDSRRLRTITSIMNHALKVRESAMELFSALKSVHRLAAGISGMDCRGGHAVRSRRLCEPQRTAPPHLLHHFAFGNSGIYAAATADHCGDRALSGEVAASPEDAPMKVLTSGRSDGCSQSGFVLLRLARALNLGRSSAVRNSEVALRDGRSGD